MNFQPKTKDDMVVTWDIMYQTNKEVMTAVITKNIDINDPSLSEKIEKLIKYFSCLKNDWIEPSRDEQKKIYLTYFQESPENNQKFENYLNIVCPLRVLSPKTYI